MANKSILSSLAILALASMVDAQSSRRELATPGLVVETGYRTGALDVLFFTPDGKYLLAAGDDKVVRTWKFQDGKLETIRAGAGEPKAVLRWPIMREHRGNIYAVALSPDERYVAVGGVGLKDSQLALLDRFEGTTKNILDTISKEKGGFNISAIAFAPSGKFVVVGGNDGSLWRWDLESKAGTLIGQHPVPAGVTQAKYNFVRLAHFLNDNEAVTGDDYGQVVKWQLGGGGSEVVAKIDPEFGGWRFAAQGNKIAIAWRTNRVTVADVNGGGLQTINLPKGNIPSALAFDKRTGRLAIAASILDMDAKFHKEIGQATYIADPSAETPVLQKGPTSSYRVEGIAFHPTKDYVALGGGNHHEITLWQPQGGDWKETSRLEGPGRAVYGLRVTNDGNQLAYQDDRHLNAPGPNDRGRGAWKVFDLKGRKFNGEETTLKGFGSNLLEQGGWKVITTRSSGWSVQNPHSGKADPLPWNFTQFGLPLCYSFLPQTEKGKVQLVVGHLYGASVFELSKDGPRRVRYLVGHDGEVYCLAVAQTKNGLLLLTGGRDETICGWALDPFKAHPMFGAQLLPRENRLVVGKVDPQSPAWEMGLSTGDEIESFYMRGARPDPYEPTFQRGDVNYLNGKKTGPLGAPDDVIDHLNRHSAGNEIVAFWSRAGHKGLLGEKTTLKERPVWRFFPTKNKEWVLWRVSDYFYDCSTAGDQYIGWHMNGFTGKGYDVFATPRFFPAEQMRKLYHQPAKISQTLSTWARQETVLQTGQAKDHARTGSETVRIEPLNLMPVPGQRIQFANHDMQYEVASGSTRSELLLRSPLAKEVPPGTRIDLQAIVPFQALEPPVVEVKLTEGAVVKNSDPKLNVTIVPRSGRENQQIIRVQVWINDFLYQRLEGEALTLQDGKDAAGQPIQFFQKDDWAIPHSLLRSGKNRLLVQAFNKADSRADGAPIVVTLDRPRGEAVFHGLFIGVGDYSKVIPNPGRNVDLKADLDAAALSRVFEEYAGKQYKKVNVVSLINDKVTPEAVFERLKKLADAHPDDLLLFHLGGHGLNVSETESQIAQDVQGEGKRSFTRGDLTLFREQSRGMGKFLFMCGNFDMKNLPTTTLRIDQLYDHLIKIPCQKIILMDACHSGAVEPPIDGLGKIIFPESKQSPDNQHANDLIRLLSPDQVGPIIFQACGAKEAALEIRGLTNVDKLYGLFSQAMVETIVENFAKADQNKNNGLESQELHESITRLIPAFLNDFKRRYPDKAHLVSEQNPRLFLPDFSRDFIIVRPTE